LYIYLATVWKVGVVVSVLEDGCHGGLDALYLAGEVVRERRAQGFLIALVLALGDALVGFRGSGRRWRGAFACAAHLLLGLFAPMAYIVLPRVQEEPWRRLTAGGVAHQSDVL
jgi:hypothetical protein